MVLQETVCHQQKLTDPRVEQVQSGFEVSGADRHSGAMVGSVLPHGSAIGITTVHGSTFVQKGHTADVGRPRQQ